MDMQIWKFPIKTTDIQTIEMPVCAEILCVQLQHGIPCVWALVEPHLQKAERVLETFGTGHIVTDEPRKYIGTYQVYNGDLVFHLFEKL